MNLKSFRRTMVMLGVIACLLLALGVAFGIATAANPATASPAVLHVKPIPTGSGDCSNWDNACTLQIALDSANLGDEIWVAKGAYTPTATTDPVDPRTATFQLVNGVEMYGGFFGTESSREERNWETNITVLSGDIDNNDITDPNGVVTTTTNISGTNSYHVVTGSGTDVTAVLDGFIITGGNADEWGVHLDPRSQGGGMYNDGGSPTVTNVTFTGNSALVFGGGMSNWENSSPTLTNITFNSNSAGAGGGMDNTRNSSPTLTNVTFTGNFAEEGGGMSTTGSPTLTNVIFTGNSADYGGGMAVWLGSPTLVNVTFSGNSAEYYGGGMYNSSSDPEPAPALTNSILWGNTAPNGPQIYNDDSTSTIYYSLVEGECPAGATCNEHTIYEDPQFVDPYGPDNTPGTLDDNLRLQLTSPAIDAGDNTALPADTLDLDGDLDTGEMLPYDLDRQPRCVDIPDVLDTGVGEPPIVDMGAYEAQLQMIYLPLVMKNYGP